MSTLFLDIFYRIQYNVMVKSNRAGARQTRFMSCPAIKLLCDLSQLKPSRPLFPHL